MNEIRLNLGSADLKIDGFLSVDLYNPNADLKMDVRKLDFPDNSVTEILASHLLEHLSPHFVPMTLKEWHRVLKPGGKLAMEMPDFEKLCKRFVEEKDYDKRMLIVNAVYCPAHIIDDEPIKGANHLFGWWPESLWHHLSWAGFVNINFMEQQVFHEMENLRVEAYKP